MGCISQFKLFWNPQEHEKCVQLLSLAMILNFFVPISCYPFPLSKTTIFFRSWQYLKINKRCQCYHHLRSTIWRSEETKTEFQRHHPWKAKTAFAKLRGGSIKKRWYGEIWRCSQLGVGQWPTKMIKHGVSNLVLNHHHQPVDFADIQSQSSGMSITFIASFWG